MLPDWKTFWEKRKNTIQLRLKAGKEMAVRLLGNLCTDILHAGEDGVYHRENISAILKIPKMKEALMVGLIFLMQRMQKVLVFT